MSSLDVVRRYHEHTKHHTHRFANSLGYLDWESQPDPFRRFEGAPRVELDLVDVTDGPSYASALTPGSVPAAAVEQRTVSQLFQDALGLTAWKRQSEARWALRANPSSGNLHPTEGYLVSGPLAGLSKTPAVYHYQPHDHVLEKRAPVPHGDWDRLADVLPAEAFLVGLTSILWREAWKYGERAFRYCQHDVGHAIGSIIMAAAAQGWRVRLLGLLTDPELARLLGIHEQQGVEAEHPDELLAVYPAGQAAVQDNEPWRGPMQLTATASWSGTPNQLSAEHHDWPIIGEVAAATVMDTARAQSWRGGPDGDTPPLREGLDAVGLRSIIHQRRSAVAMDGTSRISRTQFLATLYRLLPRAAIPFSSLNWEPAIDLVLFVHGVDGLPAGLYLLLRQVGRRAELERAMSAQFEWDQPQGCPSDLPLYRLLSGDYRQWAQGTSCGQAIAAEGVFAVAMLARFRTTLEESGAWFYRRLHWEAGLIGQVLYLEAETMGLRATGIGCFFDDETHRMLGLTGDAYQDLYHLTVGGAVDDARLQTQPPYDHLDRPAATGQRFRGPGR